MAATHQFSESNLVGEVEAIPIANLNFGSVDDHELNTTTYPITRGNASFEKYIRSKFTGVWTEISNMKLWRSDVLGYKTGETLKAATNVAYATPSATPNADSDIPLVEGSALSIQSAEGAATIIYGASGVSGYTKYVRFQLRTTGSTPSGSVFQKTITFQFDEV
jgi:hypothetical protein